MQGDRSSPAEQEIWKMDPYMTETEGMPRRARAWLEPMQSRVPCVLARISASELAGRQSLTQIYIACLVPFETAARMRKYFRVGHCFWTLIGR